MAYLAVAIESPCRRLLGSFLDIYLGNEEFKNSNFSVYRLASEHQPGIKSLFSPTSVLLFVAFQSVIVVISAKELRCSSQLVSSLLDVQLYHERGSGESGGLIVKNEDSRIGISAKTTNTQPVCRGYHHG